MSSSRSSRHSSTRPREEWSDWGKWIWSTTYSAYYRQRQDIHGNIETAWATESSYAPAGGGKSSADPRQEEIDDVAKDIENFTIDEGDAPDNENYVPSTKPSKKSKGKGKSSGKKRYDPIEEGEEGEEAEEGYDDTYRQQTYAADAGAPYGGKAYSKQTAYGDPGGGGYDYATADYNEEYGYEAARAASLHDQRSTRRHQGSSSSGQKSRRPGPDYGYTGPYGEPVEDKQDQLSSGYGRGQEYAKAPAAYDIVGRDEAEPYEPLDPRYRVEPSHRFQPGDVFKVLWPEPQGSGAGGTPTISDTAKVKTKHGEHFYVGFRRFIVVANDQGHCQCVPILTYGQKGLKKKGVKADRHGIVYDSTKSKYVIPGEPQPGFPSIRLVLEVDNEKLARESRVNYSKIVTVEHNVKVFFIGHIYPDDYQLVLDAVDACWEKKVVHRERRKR